MASGVTIVLDRRDEFQKLINELARTCVMVGIPASTPARRPDEGETTAPLTNAALGYIHEYGAPEVNIPARPFLHPGIASIQSRIVKRLQRSGELAFAGQSFIGEFNRLGLEAVNAVRKKITDGPFIPLAPATLAARRRKGRTGEKPLLDTGQLRNAITYVIRKVPR